MNHTCRIRRKATPFGGVRSAIPTNAVFSPDGRWVAYASTEANKTMIDVQPFPATGAKYQLFAREGDNPHEPLWSPDGKELIYTPRPSGLEAVAVRTEPTFAFGNPVALTRSFLMEAATARRGYDMAPAGRFVALIAPGQTVESVSRQIHVVLNWLEELTQRTRH